MLRYCSRSECEGGTEKGKPAAVDLIFKGPILNNEKQWAVPLFKKIRRIQLERVVVHESP